MVADLSMVGISSLQFFAHVFGHFLIQVAILICRFHVSIHDGKFLLHFLSSEFPLQRFFFSFS